MLCYRMKNKMWELLLLFTTVCFLGGQEVASQSTCTADLENCVSLLEVSSSNSLEDILSIPTTIVSVGDDETIDNFCSAYPSVDTCLNENTRSPCSYTDLLTAQEHQNLQNIYDSLCSPSGRAFFLEHRECIQNISVANDLVICLDHLSVGDTDPSTIEEVMELCRIYKKTYDCYVSVERRNCGDKVGDWLQNILQSESVTQLCEEFDNPADTCDVDKLTVELEICTEQLTNAVADFQIESSLNPGRIDDNFVNAICSSVDEAFRCMYDVTAATCGENEAKALFDLYRDDFGTQLSAMGCSNNWDYGNNLPSTTRGPVFGPTCDQSLLKEDQSACEKTFNEEYLEVENRIRDGFYGSEKESSDAICKLFGDYADCQYIAANTRCGKETADREFTRLFSTFEASITGQCNISPPDVSTGSRQEQSLLWILLAVAFVIMG